MDTQIDRYDLFPVIEPFESGLLYVGDGHQLYWEQSGNPDGKPVVFLHGGPGAGASPVNRRFFDPLFYRIIIFDQRGSGRSLPLANLIKNTTNHLIEDIELLRKHLGIEKWLVFGGSWGSTLALTYGIKYSKRCSGFILRGVFLGDTSELNWFLHGIRNIYPEPWKMFTEFIPRAERNDLIASYYRRLTNADPNIHMPAAEAWCRYEGSCSVMLVDFQKLNKSNEKTSKQLLALALIEAHYFKNGMFLKDGYILRNISAVKSLPVIIVQGRYDMICPIITADKLANAWPNSNYVIVAEAGHSALESDLRNALVKSTEDFKFSLLNKQT